MKNLEKKNLKILLLVAICITLITGLGTTYAFFVYRENGSNVSLVGGEVKVTFVNDNNYLTTGNSYPISDNTGKVLPYYSDFSINTVTDKVDIKYEIQLIPDAGNTIDSKYIKVYLTDQEDNPVTNVLYYDELHEAEYNDDAKAVYTSYITETGTKDFRLRLWIDESYDIKDGEMFGFTINLYAVNGKANFLINEIEDTLPLTDPDSDGTRYIYGATVDNNYVWYSGKMWRIVALNNDGTVKLITQDNITALAWSTSDTNTDYSKSQIRSWLNTEFLPTINESLIVESNWDYTTYASFPTSKITTNINSVTDKVGMLSIYDYMMTGGTADQSTSFLNNGYFWWTTSPKTSGSSVWNVNYNGSADYYGLTSGCGARPSVNLKSDITLIGNGNGEIETPYMLEGDTKAGQINELLSSRVSGEYIKFNNTKYRIVGTENGLTKITMADYSINENTLTTSMPFGASTSEATFSTTYGIGKYLDDWYNATRENDTSNRYIGLYLEKTYKDMIATPSDGVRWYAGPDDNKGISHSYLKAQEGTAISATVGIPRYGEMFSTQFGNGYGTSTNTWLMTKYSDSYIWFAYNNGYAYYDGNLTYSFGVRPSFYLKSNVKITGGSGMPHDPYTLTQ